MATEVLCYNTGCGQKFFETSNLCDSCIFHPKPPYFHEGYKIWPCCQKKSTDFTEFLNIKGCTKGPHNPKKPEIVALVKQVVEIPEPPTRPPTEAPKPRPHPDSIPLQSLSVTVTASLQRREELLKTQNQETSTVMKEDQKKCQNKGCMDATAERCIFHPGVPIFHEGMKYWTCCQKKTSDFQAFLAQTGCETGEHLYQSNEEIMKLKQAFNVRYDYIQTGKDVTITFYAKDCDAMKCRFEANSVRLNVTLVSLDGRNFELDLILPGLIDPSSSTVAMYGTKVEVVLAKDENLSWKHAGIARQLEKLVEKVEVLEIEETKNRPDVDLSSL